MARRLIGTGTTGTDGSVTIPYTGIGAGIMDLQVETEIGGETVSQNFSITDCLIYDSGINDGQKNTNVTIGTNVTEQVSNEGTTLECTNGTSLVAAQYTYNSIISGDFEAYITLTTPSSIMVGVYSGNDSSRIIVNNVTNRKYKFKRDGSVLTVQYYNGSDWVDLSWYNNSIGTKNCRFYLYLYSDNETDTVTFKDMEVLNKNENVLILDGSSNVIQSGDVVTMEGRLYKNGVLAKNTVLDVYKNGAMVGTVNTGSTGVASYNYTGLGVGETEFYFKYGSFVSEPYNVLDCEWYDDCKSATHNTNWFNRNQLQTDYTGDVLKLTGGANSGNYMPNRDGTATSIADVTEWTPSFALELDIVDFDGASYSNIGISTVGRSLSQLNITGATHLKITYDGSNVNYYKDGSTQPTYTASLTADPVYISIGVNSGHYLTIKNVEIYPI